MHSYDNSFYEAPFFLPIEAINGIKFTHREIDILACLLGRRTAKKIAFFLSISPKTVENHIRNIMHKLECNSRESIIDFVECSEGALFLKQRYTQLVCQAAFEQSLKEATAQIKNINSKCVIIYEADEKKNASSISQLKQDLQKAGVKVALEVKEGFKNLDALNRDIENHPANFVIYALSKTLKKEIQPTECIIQSSRKEAKNANSVLFLIFDKQNKMKFCKTFPEKAPTASEEYINYYFSFFEILKSLFPTLNFKDIFTRLKNQLNGQTYSVEVSPSANPSVKRLKKTNDIFNFQAKIIFKIIEWKLPITFIVLLIVCSSTGFIYFKRAAEENQSSTENFVRSDLIIPTESALLDRPDLITEIDGKLNGKRGIQTIVLIGIGGSGKTTLARQYAQHQKANVIWEINAETHENLERSFESLAETLSKSSENKQIFKEIQEIKNPAAREKKIIQFVKERLRTASNWFLIFDNVETFRDIQKYFPQDPVTWGNGKIIITTRDSNFQNNKHINSVILIGELTHNQKHQLFTKTMGQGSTHSFISFQSEETKQFLEKIPPFPLDISVAAYYLKGMNVSYAAYLEKLTQYNKDFANVQENILKESGDYAKTRYGIITLSLGQLMHTHKDFADLLLIISLLDSQNIPRELLNAYKNNNIVDSFIYNLKKYSFITDKAIDSVQSIPTFSIHRSTQEISLAYLTKELNLQKSNKLLQYISHVFVQYTIDIVDKEDLPKMHILLGHARRFLSHIDLLTIDIRGSLSSELGYIYYYLGDYIKAEKILLENLVSLDKYSKNSYITISRILASLGKLYLVTGDSKKAKYLLEQSIEICKKHVSENHVGIARASSYLAIVYRYLGNYEKAKNLLEHSLIIYKKYFSQNDVRLAEAMGNLGIIYMNLGDYEKAKNLLELSRLAYKEHSDKHIGVSWALAHLGNVYRFLGDYEKARNILEQCHVIYKEQLSENHVGIARVLSYLGIVYMSSKNYEKAKNLFEQALVIFKKNFSENHSDVARTLMNLGEVYLLENNLEIAENLINKALTIFQKNKHPESYVALENLSELYLKKSKQAENNGDLQYFAIYKTEAQTHLKKALEIIKTNFSKNSSHIIRIQDKLKKLE